MPIDDRTPGRSYQLPNLLNLLVEDWPRLRAALMAIDADVAARPTLIEVNQLISDLIAGSPGALDTLNELAEALGDDANFAATVTNLLALKSNSADVYSKAASDDRYLVNSGPLAGFRNAIINGNFDIWQRGTSHVAPGYGSADRWNNLRAGSSCTISRQAFALGQTEVPNSPTYFCRAIVTSTAGAANYSALSQNIEGVGTFAGQTVTVSFWAKADVARSIAIELVQLFGAGGSPSAAVKSIGVTKVLLGTAWQKLKATVTLPSVSGKTLGTDGDSSLTLVIWFDAGSNYNSRTQSLGQQFGAFDIAQVQLEPGAVDTVFERRPVATELNLCKRYGQWVPFNMLFYATVSGQFLESSLTWPEMRKIPIVNTLVADPNVPQTNYNNAQNLIDRATPYGGSCILQGTTGGLSCYVTGYRSWLDAEI